MKDLNRSDNDVLCGVCNASGSSAVGSKDEKPSEGHCLAAAMVNEGGRISALNSSVIESSASLLPPSDRPRLSKRAPDAHSGPSLPKVP